MWNRKLGRKADHRKALLRNMATSLIENGQIETTEMKAKELSAVMDSLVTLAKRGDLHARTQIMRISRIQFIFYQHIHIVQPHSFNEITCNYF